MGWEAHTIRRRPTTETLLLCFLTLAAAGQTVMNSGPSGAGTRIVATDMAVLEAGDPRNDLPCTVTPVKPSLGFGSSHCSRDHDANDEDQQTW